MCIGICLYMYVYIAQQHLHMHDACAGVYIKHSDVVNIGVHFCFTLPTGCAYALYIYMYICIYVCVDVYVCMYISGDLV